MPFFRRKQDKQKASSPGVKESAAVKRTPSTKSNPQSPDSINGDIGVPSSVLGPTGMGNPPKLVLSEDALSTLELDQDQTGQAPKSPMKTSSRLSKTLQEILHDKDALHCFIQFMESQHAERFIRFWLDANSFRASTLTRMRTHSLQMVGSSTLLKRRTETTKGGAGADGAIGQGQLEERRDGNVSRVCGDGESATDSAPKMGVDISGSNCDKQKTQTDATGGASSSDARLTYSPQAPETSQSGCKTEGGTEREGKPSSLSLSPTPVQRPVTLGSSHTPISSVLAEQSSPSSTDPSHSSLHDSGIAIPSDGEFVITPSSQSGSFGDSESVNTLLDDDSSITAWQQSDSRKKEADVNKAVAVSAQDGTHQAGTVISPSDTPQGGTKDDVDAQEGEGREAVGKSSRMMSVEEIREKLKKSIERDAVSIFTKYIAQDAPQPIGVDDALRGETISKICQEDKQVDPECFVACQDFVVKYMEKEYHKPFTDSEFHCKHQVTVLTSGPVYLADILYNELALCYFMEFMEQEGARHLMQFWMAADNFQQQLIQQEGTYDGMQAQNDAMILYDRFFSLQATTPLGFDDKIRFEVEGNICQENGPLPDCFSKPRDIVLHTLEKVHFPRYLSSDIYYRYLSDLINTVQMAQDLPVRKHHRQASDASSEHSVGSQSTGAESISSRNTLLAGGSRSARKAAASSSALSGMLGKIGEQLSTMDTDFLHPEDLWKQPNKGSLCLGSVNALGQFVSEFDPDPDSSKKKGGGFFKKNKSKEKEQEEMAVQVAQMILNDVANMTQMGDACARTDGNHNNNSTSTSSTSSQAGPMTSSLSLTSFSSTSFFEPPPS